MLLQARPGHIKDLFYFILLLFLEKIWMKPFKHRKNIIRLVFLKSFSDLSEENALEACVNSQRLKSVNNSGPSCVGGDSEYRGLWIV